MLNALFSSFATHIGTTCGGDNTPAYIHRMNVIDRLFPDAQYAYVMRDGWDFSLSLKQIYCGPKKMYTAA